MEEEKDEEIPEEIESVEEKKSNKIPAEKKHVSHSKGKLTGKMKENPWIISTLILGILFLILLISGNMTGNITGGTVGISQDEAGQAIADFANAQGVGLEIIGVTEESGLYKIAVSVEGQESEVYITKDGKSLVNGLIPLVSSPNQEPAQNQQQPAEIVKSDKPVVELFVMSFCPYGTQSEKGILPVFELLGDKIDSNIRFVYYAMHGDTEIYEQLNQYCIQEEQADKYYNYLTCFLEDSDGEKCLNEVGIDLNKLKECTEKADEEFSVTENFNNKDVWLSGRYPLFDIHADLNEQYSIGGSPTLIVNGVQLNAGRDPASYLAGICTTFNNAPEECGDTLSGEAPAPGFGWGETGPNTEAQC